MIIPRNSLGPGICFVGNDRVGLHTEGDKLFPDKPLPNLVCEETQGKGIDTRAQGYSRVK